MEDVLRFIRVGIQDLSVVLSTFLLLLLRAARLDDDVLPLLATSYRTGVFLLLWVFFQRLPHYYYYFLNSR